MLSRKSFEPPLTVEQLDKRVINIIPDRDIVPRIDDPGNLFQKIECRAPMNSVIGCHDRLRTFCEYDFSCGSQGRPFLCLCATEYSYPEPIKSGPGPFGFKTACAVADAYAP